MLVFGAARHGLADVAWTKLGNVPTARVFDAIAALLAVRLVHLITTHPAESVQDGVAGGRMSVR